MAQKLAPAEKNSTDISAASAAFCISDLKFGGSLLYDPIEPGDPSCSIC